MLTALTALLFASLVGFAPQAAAIDDVGGPRTSELREGSPPSARVSPDKQLTFYWGLKRKDKAVAKAVAKVANPSSSRYRQFMSPKVIATKFGASKMTVKRVKAYLASRGVRGDLDPSRAFIRVRGTAAQLAAAFETSIGEEVFPSNNFVLFGPDTDPQLPAAIAKLAPQRFWAYVEQITVGTGSSIPTKRDGRNVGIPPSKRTIGTPPTNQGTFVGTCSRLTESPAARYMMSVQQGAVAYKIDSLQLRKRGDARSKQPLIGVLALGQGYDDTKLRAAANCVGTKASAQRYRTDGMRGALPDGLEGDLDIQLVTAATKAVSKVPVFEAIGSGLSSFLGPFAALNSSDRPTVLTNSYLECEPEIGVQTRKLTDSAYSRLALAGTSAFIAAGDSGSSGCVNHDTDQGPTELAVGYPASSPFTTGVGGTRLTLNPNNSIAREVVWNDSEWGVLAGGNGGKSQAYARPWWQPKSMTGSKALTVPDISAHASTFPGFPVVGIVPGSFADPVYGTSAAAPLMASGFALLNAREMREGRPSLGFVNPWLYQQRYKAIRDITVGNNAVFNSACCYASKGYDQASGIGSPNFAKLAKRVQQPR